jgi:mono/diheme cytochrome c family protein
MKCSILLARLLGVLEAASVLAFLFGLCGTTFALAAASAPDTQKAKTLFQTKCATCHGPNGAGTSLGKRINASDLRSPEVQEQSDTDLAQVISNGKNNMPTFASSLTKEQIDALVAYVRGLASSKRLLDVREFD